MRIPSKIIDISIPLDNETVTDPAVMRPKIEYVSNKENADAKADWLQFWVRGIRRKAMIKQSTVFVIAAGASAECGLPTGIELRDQIAKGLTFRF